MKPDKNDDHQWQVLRYSPAQRKVWNDFVTHSCNATFLLQREYMDYHSERFTDCSLLLYRKRKLIALLPGNLSGTYFHSHQGLTYGGLVTTAQTSLLEVETSLRLAATYLRDFHNVSSIIYRAIPAIYHRYPAEEDLYALFRLGATLCARSVATVVPAETRLNFSTLRRRGIRKAQEAGLTVSESYDFAPFWRILEENLQSRHGVAPVHSIDEITLLQRKFPRHIRLFCTYEQNTPVAGCVVYNTERVAHAQYIAASPRGKECGALDMLFHTLLTRHYATQPYFDFGISTENGGKTLNTGLLFQKEGFGGRAVVYDTYEWKL